MLTRTALLNSKGSNSAQQRQPLLVGAGGEGFKQSGVSDLPGLPVMPETLLLLELTLQEHCVDLREASQLVLSDLGATLQILCLAGREYGNSDGRPTRIEDCISDLGLQTCLEAISAESRMPASSHQAVAETWAHSRAIANYARLAAEETADIHPEEAYLVGLLHLIGMLPRLLCWERREPGLVDTALTGFRLARKWALPPCVVEFFSETHLPGYATRWTTIMHAAHVSADRSPIECSFQNGIGPRLHRCR